ncbi:MAG: PilZ domain-containing protein [Polyangiaceae bacterium]|nr:PilZ domain-containing protein [Polyangiaceae bacterium]
MASRKSSSSALATIGSREGSTARIDKRRADADARVEVDVSLRRSSPYLAGYTERLSPSACFVATHVLEPVGSQIEVTLHVPPPDPPIRVLAEVRWQRAPAADQNLPPGLGLKFVDPDGATTAAITAYIGRHVRAGRAR